MTSIWKGETKLKKNKRKKKKNQGAGWESDKREESRRKKSLLLKILGRGRGRESEHIRLINGGVFFFFFYLHYQVRTTIWKNNIYSKTQHHFFLKYINNSYWTVLSHELGRKAGDVFIPSFCFWIIISKGTLNGLERITIRTRGDKGLFAL